MAYSKTLSKMGRVGISQIRNLWYLHGCVQPGSSSHRHLIPLHGPLFMIGSHWGQFRVIWTAVHSFKFAVSNGNDGLDGGLDWVLDRRLGALDVGAAGEASASVLVLEPIEDGAYGTAQPQESNDEVDPEHVLHSLDTVVSFWVLLDVHATKDTKEGNGQDEHDNVPSCPNDATALRHARDEIGNAGDGRENANDDSEDPFGISLGADIVGVAKVLAIDGANGDAQREEGGIDDEEGRVAIESEGTHDGSRFCRPRRFALSNSLVEGRLCEFRVAHVKGSPFLYRAVQVGWNAQGSSGVVSVG
jgi:hypothetical protein